MLEKKKYANGQITHELKGNSLTFFFKDGKIKAEGKYINGFMERGWMFYRGTGQLWQIGSFKKGMKHGSWIRYNKNNKIEYSETFAENKLVKK